MIKSILDTCILPITSVIRGMNTVNITIKVIFSHVFKTLFIQDFVVCIPYFPYEVLTELMEDNNLKTY